MLIASQVAAWTICKPSDPVDVRLIDLALGLYLEPNVARDIEEAKHVAKEKPKLWRTMASIWPDYDRYQAKTDRDIPMVILDLNWRHGDDRPERP